MLVATVDCVKGTLSLYVDGTLKCEGKTVSDSNRSVSAQAGGLSLALGARIVLLGGGKQSECRGGDIRKVRCPHGYFCVLSGVKC